MGESKQVKVDNWGIFFLQRLQTFFNKTYFCDLTLQFEDNVQLKVHRLVMNACTEYFQVLEQTCDIINDCLIMPPDLQADVVVPIVNFMYTGILEFQTSIFDRLYSTARLMNMTVLTKLLDAQKVPISPIPKPLNKRTPITPITWNLQGKKIAPKTMDPDLPEPLPGRKLPIWKRKAVPSTLPYRTDLFTGLTDPLSMPKYFRSSVDETPKPTRFEWPEDDDTSFDTNSFDEISYTSKPIIIPQREKSPKPSTSNNFEELKRSTVAIKRSASPTFNENNKKVNIQDVKEYIKEQKLRSDYIDYDDSEVADNDLQTYENDNDSDDDREEVSEQNTEDTPNKSILKNDIPGSHNKKVRFSLEGKENATKTPQKSSGTTVKTNSSNVDMTNHTKIITEVLKKYPHLVKKNKNIRLKILAKGSNATAGTPVKIVKPASKVNYVVMKSDQNKTTTTDTKKDGHWSCTSCSNPNPLQFDTYYLYRKHLTEVHNEKNDSQMCNICGHVSRKQNLLMYHKYVKHNISPPPSYHFPKCKNCNHIAVSATMLTKHQLNHCQKGSIYDKTNCPTFDCTYCTKKFISNETLLQHIRNNHKAEGIKDNLITEDPKKTIITAEEIDALVEQGNSQVVTEQVGEKSKEKIKIISDVKVTNMKHPKIQPVKIIEQVTESQAESSQVDPQQSLEPSSEAESLSNVASGIAASLGLVNTIVVLDENQFILQSQDGNQDNMIAGNAQNIILPDVSNINNIQNLVSQHQVITTDANTIISQAALNKSNITSTDELVMVLTDHDYSDATNNTVLTSENSNIVVLYSHPVQNQDGQFISQSGNLMINSDMGLVEVSNNYTVANAVPIEKPCEESIELIQQEINNHVDVEAQQISVQQAEKISEDEQIIQTNIITEPEQENTEIIPKVEEAEKMDVDPVDPVDQPIVIDHHSPVIEFPQEPDIVRSETELVPLPIETDEPSVAISETVNVSVSENVCNNTFEEPMEIDESIQMIQEELQENSQLEEIPQENSQLEEIPQENTEKVPEDIVEPTVEENKNEELSEIQEKSEVHKTDDVIKNEQVTNEAQENQEVTNDESIQDEMMEVDSAKIITDSTDAKIESENIEAPMPENIEAIIPENIEDIIPENIKNNTSVADDIISNVKKEDSSFQELLVEELSEQPIEETVSEPEKNHELNKIIEVKDDNTKDKCESIENIAKEIQDMRETEHSEINIPEIIIVQETAETIEENIEEKTKQETEIEETTEKAAEICEKREININNEAEECTAIKHNELSEEIEMEQEIICARNEESNIEKESSIKIEENVQILEPSPNTEPTITNSKISNLLDDWDDGDTDSQQSETQKSNQAADNTNSINTLINDWEDEEET